MKPPIIDLATRPDLLPSVAAWHQLAFGYLNPQRTVEERAVRLQAHLGSAVIPTTFVAFVDDAPAGCASLVAADMSTRPELSPWLAGVYVIPEQRRQGVASHLVRHVVAVARDASIATLYLYTVDHASLYTQLGWTLVERQPYLGHQVAIMSISPAG